MQTPITEQQWLALTSSKGIKDGRGRTWEVVGPQRSTAFPNGYALQLGEEVCMAIWHNDQIWTDLEDPGQMLPEPSLNDPAVQIVDIDD